MIDWVSIVRHSRRRFSNYMYAMPSKVRRRRKQQMRAQQRLLQKQQKKQQRYDDEDKGYRAVEPPPRARFSCACCVPSRKSRRVSLGLETGRCVSSLCPFMFTERLSIVPG
ncbi:hypothetical protein HPB47_021018 [Ixodes persulcatus]|uniref:Uncharacterized protein n=1 Tax=Ixodes persulcatus TaxID=34615 RepID=A0AC60QEI5_IXOPE|nr:hypothetical protein HPB47_021018 [Ixodes persulcatus]